MYNSYMLAYNIVYSTLNTNCFVNTVLYTHLLQGCVIRDFFYVFFENDEKIIFPIAP